MKHVLYMAVALVVFMSACTDPDKDPLQFDKIKQGSLITLRGDAVDVLGDPANRGAMDTFNISGDAANYSLDFQTDYLAEDPASLSEVKLFASLTETGGRVAIGTIAGRDFSLSAGEGTYPRATVKIPFTTILTAVGKSIRDFTPNQYIFIEADLTLSDGSTVPASAFANLSLFESALFYPAHKLRMIAKP